MPTILVVDDLAADRQLAGGLINKDPAYDVIYASDGKEALTQLKLHLPDLVVTDLEMPELNGLELAAAVKAEYPLIPLILMTAKGSEQIAVEALQVGASSYVPKKQLAVDLLETIGRVLAASDEERSNTRLMNRVSEITYELDNDLDLLSSLVSHLRQAVQHRRICDEGDAIRVATGLDEALLNAYYHGNLEVDSSLKIEDHEKFHELAKLRLSQEPYLDRKITVTVRFSPDAAEFTVRDQGPGFNPDSLPDPTDPEYLDRPSGRGLLLMRSFMDEVTYSQMGNEVTLVKRKKQVDESGCKDGA